MSCYVSLTESLPLALNKILEGWFHFLSLSCAKSLSRRLMNNLKTASYKQLAGVFSFISAHQNTYGNSIHICSHKQKGKSEKSLCTYDCVCLREIPPDTSQHPLFCTGVMDYKLGKSKKSCNGGGMLHWGFIYQRQMSRLITDKSRSDPWDWRQLTSSAACLSSR